MSTTDDKFKRKAKALTDELNYQAIDRGFTQQEIAAKTGLIQTNVSRTLLGKYTPRLDQFLKLADAIGLEIKITKKR